MSRAELLRAVKDEARSGDRHQIFESYRAQFPDTRVLAAVIAATARDDDRRKYAALNNTLVALLILSGVLKVLGIWAEPGITAPVALIASVAGFGISCLFAYTIYTFNAAVYTWISLLAALAILNTMLAFTDDPTGALVMLVFLGAILALSIVLKQKLFHGLKFFGVKTDAAGQYVLG